MKFTNKEIVSPTIGGHIVLESLTQEANKEIFNQAVENQEVDVVLTINGKEVDFKHFTDRWSKCVDDAIDAKAREIVLDKFWNIDEMVEEFKSMIEEKLKNYGCEIDHVTVE